jgi:hypothetical protein
MNAHAAIANGRDATAEKVDNDRCHWTTRRSRIDALLAQGLVLLAKGFAS